jgi:hypothetical protein
MGSRGVASHRSYEGASGWNRPKPLVKLTEERVALAMTVLARAFEKRDSPRSTNSGDSSPFVRKHFPEGF